MHEKHRSFVPAPSHLVACVYEAVAANVLLRFGSVLVLGVAVTSCVPAKNYDEARSAAETEFTAHGKTRSRLEAAHERVRALEQTLAERERALETGESSVAEAKLETIVASKDKEAAMDLVQQLRSELARTGNHLVAYSDEKKSLARALVLAEERVRNIEAAEKNLNELVQTAQGLSLSLGPDMKESGVELGARDGEIVLSVPRSMLFAEGADQLVVDAAPVLGAVSKVSAERAGLRIVLREPEATPLAEARIARLGAALRDRGLPEARLDLPARPVRAEEPSIAPAANESAPSAGAPDAPAAPTPESAPAPATPAPVDDANLKYEIRFATSS